MKINQWPELTDLHILPDDSVVLESEAKLVAVQKRQFILHLLIVYENDFGSVFHTYTQIPFFFEALAVRAVKNMGAKEAEAALRSYLKEKLESKEILKVGPPISRYEVYSKEESDLVRNFIAVTHKKRQNSQGK